MRGCGASTAVIRFPEALWDVPCFTILLLTQISWRFSMNTLDHLLQRNKEFAAQQSTAGARK